MFLEFRIMPYFWEGTLVIAAAEATNNINQY
jgi:hypothetical protein